MKAMFRNLPGLLVTGWLSTLAAFAPSLAGAQVHAPFAPFTATVNSSSTIFNTTQGFNGGVAGFGGSWGAVNTTPDGNPHNLTGVQTFSATFDADPGSVFTGVSLGFEGWSFSHPQNSWVALEMDWWKITAGDDIYTGPYWLFVPSTSPDGGGGGLGLPIPNSILSLNNVSSFTVEFQASIWAGGPGAFGDGNGGGLGFSSLHVGTVYTEGSPPPVTTPIPEPEIYAMMGLGLGLLGWVGRRRKQSAS